MSKAVMLSLHPKWWKKMLTYEKTCEIRKSEPKLKYSFTVYVYETKAGGGAGAVVGEFNCRWVIKNDKPVEAIIRGSCLTADEIYSYAAGKAIYCWEVFNPVNYEHPKALADFGLTAPPQSWGYVEGKYNEIDC